MLRARADESSQKDLIPQRGQDLRNRFFELDLKPVTADGDVRHHPLIELGVWRQGRFHLSTHDSLFDVFQQAFSQKQELLDRAASIIHEGGRLQVLLCHQAVVVIPITGDNYVAGYYTFGMNDAIEDVPFEPTPEGALHEGA